MSDAVGINRPTAPPMVRDTEADEWAAEAADTLLHTVLEVAGRPR